MSAELLLQIDQGECQTLSLPPTFSMGRGTGNDLVINDSRASRNHAMIRMQGDHVYYLHDLGSSNGTTLNGKRVVVPAPLKSGDEIVIANHRLVFKNETPAQLPPGAAGKNDEMPTQLEFTSATVSILVCDIRNYTGLSESIPDVELSKFVGKWFQEVHDVIDRQHGAINKFIGDAAMAHWVKAATEGNRDYILGPLRAARELLKLSGKFDEQISQKFPGQGFHVGCGINTGKAILGNVGVNGLPDITAMGDCVNVAFRLESLCKELQFSILVSEEVQKEASDQFPFVDLGSHRVKGKSQDIRVFGLETNS
jgi:adenylate cyclase